MPRNPPRATVSPTYIPATPPSPRGNVVWLSPVAPGAGGPPVYDGSHGWIHFPAGTQYLWFMVEDVTCGGCGNDAPFDLTDHSGCVGSIPFCKHCGTRAFLPRQAPSGRLAEGTFCEHLVASSFRGQIPPASMAAPFPLPGIIGAQFTPSSVLICAECRQSFRGGMTVHVRCVGSAASYNLEQHAIGRFGEEYGVGISCGSCGEAVVRNVPHALLIDDLCRHAKPLVKLVPVPAGTLRRKFVTIITTVEMALEDGLPPQSIRALGTTEIKKLLTRCESKDLKNGNITAIASVNVRPQQARDQKGRVAWR